MASVNDSSAVSEKLNFNISETATLAAYRVAKAAEVTSWNTWQADKDNPTKQAAWLLTATAVSQALAAMGAGE